MANGYKKIARGGRPGRIAITQLSIWLGPDHLLQIEGDGYAERYRRFYFKDIETFTIRRDNRQRNYTIFFVIVLAFFAWGIVVAPSPGGIVLSVPAGFLLLFLIINLAKGPSCVTHVTTAVQRQEIQSLRRVRAAERALVAVLAGSHATQGLLSAEETRMRFELRTAPPVSAPPPIFAPRPEPEPAPLPPETPPPAV